MNGNRLGNVDENDQEMVIPISVDEDSERTVEEIQALFEEYMLQPHQPGVAS